MALADVRRLFERSAEPPEPVRVEPMRRRHLRQVMPIEEQVYPRPWTIGIFQSELDNMRAGERDYLVAKARGAVLGYGGLLYSLEDAHITNVAVDPRWHRHGIGRILMFAVVDTARRHGASNLSLEVRVSNVGAQALYAQFGMTAEGVRPKYYENVEDAIIMWRRGIDTPDYAELLAGLKERL